MDAANSDPAQTATWSVISCLVSELNKSGNINFGAFIENVQGTAVAHRVAGRHDIADVMYSLSEYLQTTVRGQG